MTVSLPILTVLFAVVVALVTVVPAMLIIRTILKALIKKMCK